MEWIDKIDGVDTIYAKDINDIAHLSIAASETAKNVAYVGENGNWFIYDAVTKKYVDSGKTAEGKPGESGLPDRYVVHNFHDGFNRIYNKSHVEFTYDDAWKETMGVQNNAIILNLFADSADTQADRSKSSAITVSIQVVEDLTISIAAFSADKWNEYMDTSASIVWSGAEPTFTPGYTYFLSFVPLSDTRILGAWSEVPTV